MSRKKAETQRLPDACYDVRPASKPPRGHNWLQQTVFMCLDSTAVRSAHIGASALRAVSSQRAPRVWSS